MENITAWLHHELMKQALEAAPIDGISIGNWDDKNTWRIHFNNSATQQQKDGAQAVIDGFDVSVVTEVTILKDKAIDRFDTDKLDIAVYETIVDEFNKRRKFERDLLAAVAAATTLANLKSGIAAIVTQNAEISYSDAKQLVKNKL